MLARATHHACVSRRRAGLILNRLTSRDSFKLLASQFLGIRPGRVLANYFRFLIGSRTHVVFSFKWPSFTALYLKRRERRSEIVIEPKKKVESPLGEKSATCPSHVPLPPEPKGQPQGRRDWTTRFFETRRFGGSCRSLECCWRTGRSRLRMSTAEKAEEDYTAAESDLLSPRSLVSPRTLSMLCISRSLDSR